MHYQKFLWCYEMMMWFLKLYFYVSACMCTDIQRDQKKVLDPLELEV